MKLNFICLVIAACLMMASSSCMKEKPFVANAASGENTEIGIDTGMFRVIAPETGILVGKVVPETKYVLVLFSRGITMEEYSIDQRSGYFVFKGVPPGTYTLGIYPVGSEYNKEIEGGVILNGEITNLGAISLY